METDHITIQISYYLHGNPEVHIITLAPEEYFDLKYLDPDEQLEVESVALYWNTIDYVDESVKKTVNCTKLDIYDENLDFRMTLIDSYWNNQNSLIRKRIDYSHGEEIYNLMIISIARYDDPSLVEIIRSEKQDGIFRVTEHTLTRVCDDRSDESLLSHSRGIDERFLS